MIEWYDFSDAKSFKMLIFDLVAEAYGLICPRSPGENFSFASNIHLRFKRYLQSTFLKFGKYIRSSEYIFKV